MKSEALSGGVLQGTFINFAKFTVKHLRLSLFLIKLHAWWCAALPRRKNFGTLFSYKLSEIFKKNYFVEHVRKNAWVKSTKKIVFAKAIHGKTLVMASFLVQLQTCRLTVFPKRTPSQMLFYKNCEVYRISFLQNTVVQLLLISCETFNESLALSVINQFSHSWLSRTFIKEKCLL